MAVVSDWIQPDDYEVDLPFRTGRGEYLLDTTEGLELEYEEGSPQPPITWPSLGVPPPLGDGIPYWAWQKLLTMPALSGSGANDALPNPRLDYATQYLHTNSAQRFVSGGAPAIIRDTFGMSRMAHERWLTVWTPSKPTPPLVPPAEIPEGAVVEYEGGPQYVGATTWTIRWGGANWNMTIPGKTGNLGGPLRSDPEWGPDAHWPPEEFRLHRLTSAYPTGPSTKPPLAAMAATQPVIDSLSAQDTGSQVDSFTEKTTIFQGDATLAGQLCFTVRPRIWTDTGGTVSPRHDVTDEQAEPWTDIPSLFRSERVGRIMNVTARQTVRPPRYRFVWPGGQYRLRQRQTLPGSDGWPLRQRQNGAHSGSWPLRQRQTGV